MIILKSRQFVLLSLFLLTSLHTFSQWQVSQLDSTFLIDFDNPVFGVNHGAFAATGYSPSFSSGALDSDAWSVFGLSSGDLRFGDSVLGADFGRGLGTGGVSTGGIYAFDVDSSGVNNLALGVQPGGTDFTPGYHLLKVSNASGDTVGSFNLSYQVYEYNDQGRSSLVELHWSIDGIDFTHEEDLDFISGDTASGSPVWSVAKRSVIITTEILPGDSLLLKWYSDDYGGSGSRDEIALDSIALSFHSPGNLPPVISNVATYPEFPQSGDSIIVSAMVADDDGVDTVYILWGTDSLNTSSAIGMMRAATDSFVSQSAIPPQPDSTNIFIKVVAGDAYVPAASDTTESYLIRVIDSIPVALSGDIIISEIMINPLMVADSRGEYIEIYNASDYTFNLLGYFLQDSGGDSVRIETNLIIQPREFKVLSRDTMAATNGGFHSDYEYGGFTLSNLNDEIYLLNPDRDTVDKVEYNGGLVWLGSGAAIVFQGAVHQDNNNPALWSAATSRQPGYLGTVGDFGSPGNAGQGQVIDRMVFVDGAWSEMPDSASGDRKALVRRGEYVLFSADASVQQLIVEPLAGLDLGGFSLMALDSVVLEADSTGYSQLIGEVDGQVVWQSFLRSSNQARWFNLAIPLNTRLDSARINNGGLFRTLAETGGDTNVVNIWTYDAGMSNPITGEGTWIPVSSKQDTTYGVGFSWYSGAPHFGQLPQTLKVSGQIEGRDVQIPLSNPVGVNQYNFVGNPFACALDWDEITADNPGINKTYFIYDDGPDSAWVAYNSVSGAVSGSASPFVAPGQAFFINANNQAILEIETDAAAITAGPTLFRNIQPPGISIKVISENGREDFTYLGFLTNGTDSFDPGFDAEKRLNAARFSPSIYTTLSGKNFMFNFIEDLFSTKTIPLNLVLNADTRILMDFDIISIDPSWSLTLEDLHTGSIHDIRNGGYTFNHGGGMVKREFRLHLKKLPVNGGNDNIENTSVYIGGALVFKGVVPPDARRLDVYDLAGSLKSWVEISHSENRIELNSMDLNKGVLILVWRDESGAIVFTRKIMHC